MAHTSKGTPKKAQTVTELVNKVAKAKAMIVADYRGLKHKQLEELRRHLKKVDGEFVITKNRLFKRALRASESAQGKLPEAMQSIEELLEQPTATLFAYADEVAPLKELFKFFKIAGAGTVKGGLLGETALSQDDLTRLSTLPGREILLGKLVGQLNAPIQGLHYALQWNLNKFVWAINGIKNSKS